MFVEYPNQVTRRRSRQGIPLAIIHPLKFKIMAKLKEIASISEEKVASNGNEYKIVTLKASKVKGVITLGERICIWEDFDLYEVGDKVDME